MPDSDTTPTRRATQLRRLAIGAVRNPGSIRFVPRLARSYGHSTLELRVPWLAFEVIDLLEARLDSRSQVFEFGGGGSTLWFADRVRRVVTTEHDTEWLTILRAEAAGCPNVELRAGSVENDYADYVAVIDDFEDETFDVIVVDGRERVRCFERAFAKVKPGGLLVLDDARRERYAPAFEAVDWPREVYDGYAPCKDDIAHTAVFSRP